MDERGRVLVSVTPDELDVASQYDFDVELDLDWGHERLLTGKDSLIERLAAYDVAPEQVKSIHLPPGTRTRGSRVGMAATPANRGAVGDFVHGQLGEFDDPFLVMHPDKDLSYTEQLPLLATYTDITGHDIAIENTASADHWRTPEDLAFYAWAAEERPELDRLHLTVDSAHFPSASREADGYDHDAADHVCTALGDAYSDVADDYLSFLEERAPDGVEVAAGDPYQPLARTLALAGDRVQSVHFNDPETNNLPRLRSRHEDGGAYAAVEAMAEHDVYTVLKPDALLDDPQRLSTRRDAVAEAYAAARQQTTQQRYR